ncbi:MAG: glutaminyl-peptide cyclotransferase [Proteobacteria bacterium]|nr:glutaminyl-peptide cyclotransferase [Pseudomonadota bacterium]
MNFKPLILLCITLFCAPRRPAFAEEIQVLAWRLVATYPHDPKAYTQGLLYWEPGILAESTGRYGASSIRRVDLKTGKVLDESPLQEKYFGEGLARVGNRFIQLTWQNNIALAWNWSPKHGWTRDGEFTYEGEGWGLSTNKDGKLVMSNGSSAITVRNPKTFAVERTTQVTGGKDSLNNLNELEFVRGHIFANRWQTSIILRIRPDTGQVDGILDIHSLIPPNLTESPGDAVANGIAWDPKKKTFYVTGKFWPKIYEIKVEGYR